MKCLVKKEKVVRVGEHEVDALLKDGWEFCPKWMWKEQEGILYKGEKKESPVRKRRAEL